MILLHNTLTGKKEKFTPLLPEIVKMYHCGPTVYSRAHIGNLRSFVTWDTLRRIFSLNGFTVKQIMNITDVDDKTIARSQKEAVPLKELTERYTEFFLKDMIALNILLPHALPKATEYIEDMIFLIERLLKNGLAYKSGDGSVYFKISGFKKYGALAGLKNVELKKGVNVSHDEYDKENIHDFALWKAWSKADGSVFWETRIGKGRPGWHIECSAMSMKELGEEFDIHTGGRDLIFPHHTNEIAQSEGATGKTLSRFWLHNEFVTVTGKKMAKSEGNIITLEDIAEKGINPIAYRYWLLTAHYRTLVNFSFEALMSAERALNRLYKYYGELGEDTGGKNAQYAKDFEKHIVNDLDTAGAIAVLWNMVKDGAVSPEDKKTTLLFFDEYLGLGLRDIMKENIPQDVKDLITERERVRVEKNWSKADELRKKIEALGYKIKDSDTGAKISRK